MIVTEEQAKRLVCPARPPMDKAASGSEIFVRRNPMCLGQDCMWWEWEDHAMDIQPTDDSYLSKDIDPPRGYCGDRRWR